MFTPTHCQYHFVINNHVNHYLFVIGCHHKSACCVKACVTHVHST